uniref:Metallo-beta-lactamase domain-containing protein n=1 Tax=Kalanchoe fedtschenkoi TaxID=63787 RepID=A0A7N0T5Q9_KALFE
MALQCRFNFILSPFSFCKPKIQTLSPFSPTLYTSSSSDPKLSAQRHKVRNTVCAVTSKENSFGSSAVADTDIFKLTYLEVNGWLWEVNGLKLLVDPILVGNLDFGMPWLSDGAKKTLKNFSLSDLPDQIDCLLITQSLDDHCHLRTLRPLSQKYPNLRVIATRNAKTLLDPLFTNVTYIEPGQSHQISTADNASVEVRATGGPIVGLPWEPPEKSYMVTSPRGQLSLYFEPHCLNEENIVEKLQADIVITPVTKQLLSGLTLVSGQEDAVKLAKLLKAKFVVPMSKGDLDAKGLLTGFLQPQGTTESFKALMSQELPRVQVLEPTPGQPLEIRPPQNLRLAS